MNLALFIGDTIQSYEAELLIEIQKLAKEREFRLDIFANCVVPSGDYLHVEGLKKVFYLSDLSKYDGIITADDTLHNYDMNKDLRAHLKKATCPIVCLRNSVDGCSNVIFDDKNEIYNMTNHVIKIHNCRNIGFVTGTFELDDSLNRLKGFRKAMEENGLEIDENQDIFNGNYWSNQGDETAEFFARRSKGLPEAIICSNDYMAIALIDSLKKMGIKCPEDIIVTGLDNIPESSENIPMLTTIEFDIREMLTAAVELIEQHHSENDRHEEKAENKETKLIKGKCIYRSSCGCMDINDILLQNYKMMRDIISEEYNNAIQCVNMNMDFGSVLDTEGCIKRALQLLRNTGRYSHIYAVMKNRLFAEVHGKNKVKLIPESAPGYEVSHKYPISKKKEHELDSNTNVFYTINCQDELYGYFVLQLKGNAPKYFDVVTSQLLIMVGNTLKKLELLSYQGELQDIKRLYQQDPLTELYNRRGFENNLRALYQSDSDIDFDIDSDIDYNIDSDINSNIEKNEADTDETNIEEASSGKHEKRRVIISSIDVDGLKYINDNFGHFEGDRAIKAVAECLQEVLKEGDFAARIGGDEFSAAIILGEHEDMNDFRNKLYAAVKQKSSRFTKYTLGVSIGLAEIKSYRTILEGMKEADKDMYREKKLHHNTD